jgi:release factor glutamine methyltransferase
MSSNKTWTLLEILNWTTNFLKEKNIKEARYKTELLIADILKMKRFELYTNFEYELMKSESTLLKEYIKRVISREPIQYILGRWEFYGYELTINKNVLIPRSETEELVEKIIEFIKNKDIEDDFTILDLGTGSGAIIISLYKELENLLTEEKFRRIKFIASDYSLKAIDIAQKNSVTYNSNIEFIHSDLFQNLEEKRIDLLVSNPPYISIDDYNNLEKELFYEPKIALTDNNNGLYFYEQIIQFINKRKISSTFLEIGYDQKELLTQICKANNIDNFQFYKDLSQNDRMLIIT